MYQPQPAYPAAPYGGYMPPQNPYAYTPPPPSVYQPYTAPAADPYGGYLGPPPESPTTLPPPIIEEKPKKSEGNGMPPPPILPPTMSSYKGAKKVNNTKSSGCGTFVKILPFGGGQFCNGSALKGVFFLGSELTSLYFYKSNSDAAATISAKLNTIRNEREAARSDTDDVEAFDAETEETTKKYNAAIAKSKQQAQLSLVSFGGFWALGVIDAFVNEPSGKSTSKSPKLKRKKKAKIIQSFHLDLEKAPMGFFALSMPYEQKNLEGMDLLMGYAPTTNNKTSALQHSLALGLSWEL